MLDNLFTKMNKGVTVVFYIICILAFFNTCNSCNRNRNEKNLMKELDSLKTEQVVMQNKLDSVSKNMINSTDLKLEGLKTEKRMIQSCDRKIWDLNREKAIDIEVDSLTKAKYVK